MKCTFLKNSYAFLQWLLTLTPETGMQSLATTTAIPSPKEHRQAMQWCHPLFPCRWCEAKWFSTAYGIWYILTNRYKIAHLAETSQKRSWFVSQSRELQHMPHSYASFCPSRESPHCLNSDQKYLIYLCFHDISVIFGKIYQRNNTTIIILLYKNSSRFSYSLHNEKSNKPFYREASPSKDAPIKSHPPSLHLNLRV